MPYNGSGTYTGPSNSWNPAVSATTINPTDWNSTFDDLELALTTALTKDGQTTPTANLPMGGYKHTGVSATSGSASGTEYVAARVAQSGSLNWGGTAGGTADALTLTLTPAAVAYGAGLTIAFKAGAAANTGAVTVNVNSLGAKDVQKNGAALGAGDIAANAFYEIIYDGTAFQISPLAVSFASLAEAKTGTDVLEAVNPAGLSAVAGGPWTDIASASTVNIGAADVLNLRVTGTTTITAFDTIASGLARRLRFAGALTLTHNGTSLILPAGANITTAANDVAVFVSLGSGNWQCVDYLRANGMPLAVATQAQMETATSTAAVVTPGVVQYHPGVAKAWVVFNGTGTPAIRASHNVSSITDNGTGDYTINFTTPFSSANYSWNVNANRGAAGATQLVASAPFTADPTTTALRIVVTSLAGTQTDAEWVSVQVFGDQ